MAHVVNRIGISTMALAAALALAACQPSNTGSNTTAQTEAPPAPPPLPLAATPVQAQAAPPTTRLPSSARRVRYANLADPRDAYAYADQAYAMSNAFADAPPDYALDDNGVRPLVWRSHDDDYQVAEPTPYGYRYYYYRSGRPEPFMVRDPDYAYSYADGQLVAVFDRYGRPVPVDQARQREDSASRLLYRAERLFELLRRGARTSASAPNWAEHRRYFEEDRARWASEAQRNPDWTDYDQRHSAELNGYWSAEAVRRRQEAQNFNAWRDRGYQGEPPPRAYEPPPPPQAGPSGVVGQLMQLLNRQGGDRRDGDHRDQRPQGGQPASPPAQPSPPANTPPVADWRQHQADQHAATPTPATPPANTPPNADWRQRQADQHVAPPPLAVPPSPAAPSAPQNNPGPQGHEHRPFAGPPAPAPTAPPVASPPRAQIQPPAPPAPSAPVKPPIVTPTAPTRPAVIAPPAVKPPPPPLPKPPTLNLTPAQQQALREAVAKATAQPTNLATGQAVRPPAPTAPPPPAPPAPAPKPPAAPPAKPATPPHPANADQPKRNGVEK
jgi:hypothetical protein